MHADRNHASPLPAAPVVREGLFARMFRLWVENQQYMADCGIRQI